MGGAACQHPLDPSSLSAPQEAAHKRLMCRRQACEAQTPELLRRHRSLTAHSLLPLAEKQRRVLRNLRRLEGLGLVSARDGYQGLVDELGRPLPGKCPPKIVTSQGKAKRPPRAFLKERSQN